LPIAMLQLIERVEQKPGNMHMQIYLWAQARELEDSLFPGARTQACEFETFFTSSMIFPVGSWSWKRQFKKLILIPRSSHSTRLRNYTDKVLMELTDKKIHITAVKEKNKNGKWDSRVIRDVQF
jgi:hypothetical protein